MKPANNNSFHLLYILLFEVLKFVLYLPNFLKIRGVLRKVSATVGVALKCSLHEQSTLQSFMGHYWVFKYNLEFQKDIRLPKVRWSENLLYAVSLWVFLIRLPKIAPTICIKLIHSSIWRNFSSIFTKTEELLSKPLLLSQYLFEFNLRFSSLLSKKVARRFAETYRCLVFSLWSSKPSLIQFINPYP